MEKGERAKSLVGPLVKKPQIQEKKSGVSV